MDGLRLYPLDWVSNQLERALVMFAEVTPSMRRQICRVEGLPDGLIGYRGASAFDFYNSRYRRVHRRHPPSGDGEKHSMLIPRMDRGTAQLMQTASCVA